MDTFEIEVESTEPNGFTAIVPAVPGLLVLGRSVDEVLERARAAIAFHDGRSGSPEYVRRISVAARDATRRSVA